MSRETVMFERKKCGKLLGSKALHALHFHEHHDGPITKTVLNIIRLRMRLAKTMFRLLQKRRSSQISAQDRLAQSQSGHYLAAVARISSNSLALGFQTCSADA
nr:putative integron gene cassette protein [uncultured bacterium]